MQISCKQNILQIYGLDDTTLRLMSNTLNFIQACSIIERDKK